MNANFETETSPPGPGTHSHVFLGAGHARSERKTWTVIVLCGVMMAAEIIAGSLFNSVALIADGLHMSTHAGALLIAALAYTYARRHAADGRFTFGTGKLGDLAGYTSAIVLAMIAILIAYEAVDRLFSPVPINFDEAIPIAVLGLLVNLASALLLSDGHHHDHDHGHDHDHHHDHARGLDHEHGGVANKAHRDNNMRAAFVHVLADAAVSVLVIVGLVLGRGFGWVWLDPVVGMVGALVIASWAFGLVRDTGAILLDVNPDHTLAERMRSAIEVDGDRLVDLHLWRLGPGHLGAIVAVVSDAPQNPDAYRGRLVGIPALSHVTVEVRSR